jgi:hypothetical protein
MKETSSKLILILVLMVMNLLNNDHVLYPKVHMISFVLLEDINKKNNENEFF